ncbi:helix-turn-helix domain-containing protein [Komagataeibacter europaeus]|uniref:helix-turn-helix domain-containing protein n=1 Tax=Komagataeibacter europaeus TaxID=33995 RepID=UPI0015FAD16E|nr:helix-turn-helix domain-containing protein [Komagataeibacter europaeus]
MKPAELISRAGGACKLSRALGMKTHSAVLKWKAIPVCHLIRIEQIYAIPREELRPELFKGVTVVRPAALPEQAKGA